MSLMGIWAFRRSYPFPLIRFVDQTQAIYLYKPQAKIIEAKKAKAFGTRQEQSMGP